MELDETYRELDSVVKAIKREDINKLHENKTPLMRSILVNPNEKIVKVLIKAGADVNIRNNDLKTALMYAVEGVDDEIVKVLIDAGSDVNIQDDYNRTALIYAVETRRNRTINKKIVELLIEKGADVNTRDSEGTTPLMFASMGENIEIINILIENGGNVNGKSDDDMTPLMFAESDKVVNILIKNGADMNARNENGMTPLMFAEFDKVVNILIKNGADVNARRKDGETALFMSKETTKELLRLGADVNIKNNKGFTCLMIELDNFDEYIDDMGPDEIVDTKTFVIECLNAGANMDDLSIKQLKTIVYLMDDNDVDMDREYRKKAQEKLNIYYKRLLTSGVKKSFIKPSFIWEKWCKKLGKKDQEHLVEFARELSLDSTGTKRELCSRISREFYNVVDGCKDYNLSGDSLQDLPKWRIYKIDGICFDILDLEGIIKTGETRNPYTREEMPVDDIKETIEKLRKLSSLGSLKEENLLTRVKEMPIFSLKAHLNSKTSKLFESFPYSLDTRLVTAISEQDWKTLYNLFYNIRYILELSISKELTQEPLDALKLKLIESLLAVGESSEKVLIIYQTFVHFNKIQNGESTEDSLYTTISESQ
jgi:ankyrin repeat protein